MSEPTETRVIVVTEAELRRIVQDAVSAALNGNVQPEKETLLTPDEAAALIGVKKQWLYQRADRLPFTRRLSRKAIRFSEAALRRWLASRK